MPIKTQTCGYIYRTITDKISRRKYVQRSQVKYDFNLVITSIIEI